MPRDVYFDLIGPEGTPTYTTIAAMNAAIAASEIAECDVAYVTAEGGYYAVNNGEATSVCLGSGIVTESGGAIDFADLITLDTQLFLAAQQVFPGIRDYSGTYDDTELCDLATLPARESRGLLMGGNRKLGQYGSNAALQITGEITVRSMFKVLATVPATFNILDYAGPLGSGAEADNFLWNANVEAEGPEWNHETGAVTPYEGTWILPGRFRPNTEYIVDFQRDASAVVNCWVNGLPLRRLINLVNATDGGDGDLVTVAPTGGGNAQLCEGNFASNANIDAYWGQVEDAISSVSPTDYVAGRREWTAAELFDLQRSDHASVAAELGVVSVFQPTALGLEDVAGTLDYSTDWSTSGTVSKMLGDHYWTSGGSWLTAEPAPAALLIDQNLSLTVTTLCPSSGTGCLIVCDSIAGGNHLYLLIGEHSLNQVRYFHRDGSNYDVSWTIDATSNHELREYHLKRTHLGTGNQTLECWERKQGETSWTKLTVKATTGGSGVGTTTGTIPECQAAATQRFEVYSPGAESQASFCQYVVRNTAIDPPSRSVLA